MLHIFGQKWSASQYGYNAWRIRNRVYIHFYLLKTAVKYIVEIETSLSTFAIIKLRGCTMNKPWYVPPMYLDNAGNKLF